MSYKNVLFEKRGPIAILSVNRPYAMNALNYETLMELQAAVGLVAEDKELRVLILTGAEDIPAEGKKPKPRAFVAGADIVTMSKIPVTDRETPHKFVWAGQNFCRSLENLSIPVIAAVDGFALGGGTELAIACDIIYASTRAQFGQPEVKLGLIPGFGGTQRLPRLIGRNLAKELIYTGDIIDAERAHQIGLVNAVFPPEALMDKVLALAERIIACAPYAVACSKEAVNHGYHLEMDAANRVEVDCFERSFSTEDRLEGTTAFVERRKADFKGR